MRTLILLSTLLFTTIANAEVIAGIVDRARILNTHPNPKNSKEIIGTRELIIKASDGTRYTVIHTYTLTDNIAASDYSYSDVRAVPVRDVTQPAVIKETDVVEISVKKDSNGILRSRAGEDIKLLERTTNSFARDNFDRAHGIPQPGDRVLGSGRGGYAR